MLLPVSIALILQDPGLNAALTRYVSMYHKQENALKQSDTIITGLIFSLAIAIALSSALNLLATPIATAFLQQSDLDQVLRVSSFAVIGQAILNTANSVFMGYMKAQLQNITIILNSIAKGLISSGLVILGFGLSGAIVGNVAAYLIAGAIALIIALRYVNKGIYPSRETLRELLSFGIPLYLSKILAGALSQFTSSIMVIYVANEEIGNYGAAITFAILINFLTDPIQTTIYPLFSKLEKGSEYLRHAYQNAVKYSSLVAVPGALALIGLAGPLIATIYGDKYPTAAGYFAAYLITYIPIGVGNTCQPNLLASQGETRALMWRNTLSLLIGAPLAFILIPGYGIPGLIASLIASSFPALIYGHYYIKNNLGITFDRTSSINIYISALISLVTTLVLLIFVHIMPFIELVAGAITYLAAYLVMLKVTRTLNLDDYHMFGSILGTTGPLSRPLLRLLEIYEEL